MGPRNNWLQATIGQLGSSDNEVAAQAEARLIQSTERRLRAHQEMVDRLIEATSHPDPQIRWRSGYVLAATHDPRAYPRLAEMVHDPDADVRYEVAMALGTYRYTEAVNLLISLMGEAHGTTVSIARPPCRFNGWACPLCPL